MPDTVLGSGDGGVANKTELPPHRVCNLMDKEEVQGSKQAFIHLSIQYTLNEDFLWARACARSYRSKCGQDDQGPRLLGAYSSVNKTENKETHK